MKKVSRLISLLVALAMFLTLLAGCTTVDEETTPGETTQEQTTKVTETTDDKGPSWTWDTSPVELDIYVNESWFTTEFDADKNVMDKYVTELTGVTINWQSPVGVDANERFNAMLAADDLPDIVLLSRYSAIFEQAQATGRFHPILELADKYAPTFRANIPQSKIDWWTQDDGVLYALINYYWDLEEFGPGNYLTTNQGMMARKDIMDDLGIKPEDFMTQDGFFEALKKVKDSNYEFEGQRVIPFFPQFEIGHMTSWMSVPREDASGNYIDPVTHPKYLEGLQFLNRLYREGLISDDTFTAAGENQIKELMSAGRIFVFEGNTANFAGNIIEFYDRDPEMRYVPIPPYRAADGGEPIVFSSGTAGWLGAMVPKSTEKAERAIRFLEFAFSDHATQLFKLGVPGYTYEVDENNWPLKDDDGFVVRPQQYLEDRDNLDTDAFNEKYSPWVGNLGFGAYWIGVNPVHAQLFEHRPADPARTQSMEDIYQFFANYAFDERAFTGLHPSGDSDEGIIRARINEDFNPAQIIVSANSADEVEEQWNAAIDRMKDLGWDSLYEYWNGRFQENKEAMGVDFAWPTNQ